MGLLSTAAKAAVASSVHGRVQRHQQQKWAAQDAHHVPRATSAPAGDPGALDIAQQLALIGQLNDLRQAGALSDAEFEAKKADDPRLLSSPPHVHAASKNPSTTLSSWT